MNKSCNCCLFFGLCSEAELSQTAEEACEDFYPSEHILEPLEMTDAEIDTMIEERRREFYSEWFEYISENED